MQVIDRELLESFRTLPRCEWCGRAAGRLHPHHLFGRGMGGGSRVDVRCNLVGLCAPCHHAHHDGNHPTRAELLGHVARRDGLVPGDVEAAVQRLRRTPR